MNNLIDIVLSPVNITLTILMLILVLYWLVTMVSGVDFDLDFDVDVDIDVDIDADFDTNIEGGNVDFQDISSTEVNKEDIVRNRRKPLKWWQVVLVYFNFVGLPFMFTFTCWIFIWWILTTMITTATLSYENTFGFIIMLFGFFPALILTKIFTTPFKGFFRNLNKDGDLPIDVIGRRGVCLSTIKENKMGSAEVVVENTPLSIYVKSLNGEQINFREPILIIKQSTDKNYYYAQSYITN
ncbi:hypothetical protein [Polaribacter litorisediminis]|uniref:hypothetical protein n=1 Tax=Polaribacter litorisediminis TaxID=1908341 RepID=UPI001CBFA1E0|nr:hypothetical protein [Polaribacter litorisediminis]